MPNINISITGQASSSANGTITDAVVLQKVNDVILHLQEKSFRDPPQQDPAVPPKA